MMLIGIKNRKHVSLQSSAQKLEELPALIYAVMVLGFFVWGS